jgi:hypothetical protein
MCRQGCFFECRIEAAGLVLRSSFEGASSFHALRMRPHKQSRFKKLPSKALIGSAGADAAALPVGIPLQDRGLSNLNCIRIHDRPRSAFS